MLQVSSRLTLQSIEENLSIIRRAPDQKVFWPLNVRGAALGAEAALVQLLVTWASEARKAALHLSTNSLSHEQIDDFVRQLYGIVASLVCDGAFDQNGRNYHDLLQTNALLKLYQLDGPNPRSALHRLHDVAILCADHLGRSSPRLLYYTGQDRAPVVRNEKEFRLLADWLFKSIVPAEYDREVDRLDTDSIGSMLHEIFENTDEHATRDINGNALNKSIRGFFARHHWLSQHETVALTAGYPALKRFCDAMPATSSDARRQLIELSVFDSGPGFAQRLTNKPLSTLSTKEEFDAVQHCFRGGITTKIHSGHGIGLKYVVRLLRQKKGFLRLRTGRLSLFADLSSPTAMDAEGPPSLRDASDGDIRRVSPVQGTLLSLLIPLVRT
jgi:hypothetical protein